MKDRKHETLVVTYYTLHGETRYYVNYGGYIACVPVEGIPPRYRKDLVGRGDSHWIKPIEDSIQDKEKAWTALENILLNVSRLIRKHEIPKPSHWVMWMPTHATLKGWISAVDKDETESP
jgi:hypothetical protein